jgi:hypothetical protein
MAKPQAPRKGLTGCHFTGTCPPLHCLGAHQQFVEPPMAGRNMLSLGSQVLGRSVRRYGTRLELCGASRGSADSPAIHFIVPYSAGAPSTIQYGPVRSKSTSLCEDGWKLWLVRPPSPPRNAVSSSGPGLLAWIPLPPPRTGAEHVWIMTAEGPAAQRQHK